MLWVSVGGLNRGSNKRTLDSVEEDIAEHRNKIHQPVEQKISAMIPNDKEGQGETLDIETEPTTKRDHTAHRDKKQKIRKEQKVLRILEKAEGKLKKDVDRRRKQGNGNVRVEEMFLGTLDEGENGKRMKEMIITEPIDNKLRTDHTVTSVLEVKDQKVKADDPEKENGKTNPLGQSLAMMPVERKSDEAPGLMSGEDQRGRWWRKQGFY